MAVLDVDRDLSAVLAAEHSDPFSFFRMHSTADG